MKMRRFGPSMIDEVVFCGGVGAEEPESAEVVWRLRKVKGKRCERRRA